MKALVLNEIKKPLVLEDVPSLEPKTGEVVVDLKAAALATSSAAAMAASISTKTSRRLHPFAAGFLKRLQEAVLTQKNAKKQAAIVAGLTDHHYHYYGRYCSVCV